MAQPDQSASTKSPLPGEVLYLADPYCWYRHADVRPYLNSPAYAVRIDRPASDQEQKS